MGRIRLTGATSGYTELRAANAAGNNTITLPTTTGGEVIVSDSSGNVSIDSGTFYIDASNNRVGIGTSSPGQLLEINGASNPCLLLKDTTNNVEAYVFSDDSVANFGSPSAHPVVFRVQNAERMRIDTSGRVGIGTTSPVCPLHVSNGGANGIEFFTDAPSGSSTINSYNRSSSLFTSLTTNAAQHIFLTSSTERARIDSSGRLLVGTTSARTTANITSQIQIEGTGFSNSSLSLTANSNDSDSAYFIFTKTRGTSVGSNTLVQSGDQLGYIGFGGADGVDTMQNGAGIAAYVDGTPGANDMPGRLVFSTTADGASSPTERMRITNSGTILVNRTTDTATLSQLALNYPGNTRFGSTWNDSDSASTGYPMRFARGGTEVGAIAVSGSSTAYNTSSDYRLKENITTVTDGIIRLQQLKPSRFNFIADPNKTVDGFIAHEVQTVVPEAITGEKDAVDADGNPVYQGIDQSKLVPLLTAALQEAMARIETLEAKVAALESA